MGSLILTHEWDGEVPGLKAWAPEDRPFSPLVFWTFRLMVGLGLLMILVGLASLYLRWRGRLAEAPGFLRLAVVMGPSGFVAVLAGWVTTEVGRQPYVVYGLLRTAEVRSPIDALAVGGSLAAFVVVYLLVFGAGIYYLVHLMGQPPVPAETGPEPGRPQRAAGITPAQAMEGQATEKRR
jgi:cytochrome d ubiquinol oxidase subunit I